jgi:hypothetical protein
MLLILAFLLLILFGGIGFAIHVFWWGLILAVILAVAHLFTRGHT